jgi:hypothetical protein
MVAVVRNMEHTSRLESGLALIVLAAALAFSLASCAGWQSRVKSVAKTASDAAEAAQKGAGPMLAAKCRSDTKPCETRPTCVAAKKAKASLQTCCPELAKCRKRREILAKAAVGVHLAAYAALRAVAIGDEQGAVAIGAEVLMLLAELHKVIREML